jgi:thioredoxin-dependent peroxiredoxin
MHCRHYVAQLRHDYEKFQAANTEMIVIVPNKISTLARFLNENPAPFPILSDPDAPTAQRYGVDTKQALFLTLFTRTMFLVDRAGVIRYAEYGVNLLSEPDDRKPLAVLAGMAQA